MIRDQWSLGRDKAESVYWLVHAPVERDEFVRQTAAALNRQRRGLGGSFRPLLASAIDEAASVPLGQLIHAWASRVESVRLDQ